MNKKKFIKELLTLISTTPNLAELGKLLQQNLEEAEQFSRQLKMYAQYAAFIASIIMNVLQAIGWW